jgi:hypothetical protein
MDRYQSVAKFAADVAAVTGRSTAGAVPHTRSMGDTDKTQLLDATAGPTQRMSAKKAAASPAPKKRSLIPAVVGVVVILAGGGAWVALNGGSKSNPNDVAHDTATSPGKHQTGGVTTLARDTGRRTVRLPPPSDSRSGIDPARANDLLTALIEATPLVVKDSAAKIYNTPGVTSTDRAFAACMIARAEEDLGNHNTAVLWANRGLAINSGLSSCRSVIQGGS